MPGDGVLSDLIKAKENIKRKYLALKHGEADIQSSVATTLKSIIDPLNEIKNQQQQSNFIQNERQIQDEDSNYDNVEQKFEDEIHEPKLDELFKSPDFDKTYGPGKLHGDYISFGKEILKITDKLIIINSSLIDYPLTEGLLRLIFLKSPSKYTEHDLDAYKSLLVHSRAHLTKDETRIKKGGSKYRNIIAKLFCSGSGLNMTLQRNNLVYWNDPNELVDRLRLLLASRAAGNTGVENEIVSIFEELYEMRIIKRIPDV